MKERKRISWIAFIFLLISFFSVFILVNSKIIVPKQKLEHQYEEKDRELKDIKMHNGDLSGKIKTAKSTSTVIDSARKEGYVNQGELMANIVFSESFSEFNVYQNEHFSITNNSDSPEE